MEDKKIDSFEIKRDWNRARGVKHTAPLSPALKAPALLAGNITAATRRGGCR